MSQTSLDSSGQFVHELSKEFSHENLYLLIEGIMFCVNRKNFVNDSEFFREMFELPPEKGKPVDGSSLDYPLRVEGVKKEDLTLLLRAMFPAYIHQDEDMTSDQWITILNLLTMWRFNLSRNAVLKTLKAMTDSITQIMLYHQFDLDAEVWLIPPVQILARRKEWLGAEEARRLGLDDTVKIAAVREEFYCCCVTGASPPAPVIAFHSVKNCPHRAFNDFRSAIRRIYNIAKP